MRAARVVLLLVVLLLARCKRMTWSIGVGRGLLSLQTSHVPEPSMRRLTILVVILVAMVVFFPPCPNGPDGTEACGDL